MKLLALTLAAFGLLVGTATAGTTMLRPDGSPAVNWQRFVDESHVPTPDITIRVSRDLQGVCNRTDVGGCAARRDGVMALAGYAGRWVFYHELGHFADATFLSDTEHARFAKLFGEPFREWEVRDSDYDLIEPFAVLYSWCATGHRLSGWRWKYVVWGNVDTGIRLARWQVRAGCRLIGESA